MPSSNIRAIVLRTHNEHRIECSRATENEIVSQVEDLWNNGRLDRDAIVDLANRLPERFFRDARLDSPGQYARLLADSLAVSQKVSADRAGTIFYGPVE